MLLVVLLSALLKMNLVQNLSLLHQKQNTLKLRKIPPG
jgi:hypothetical protein